MKADGHIHTPYCPHGTKDAFEAYIKRAMELNFTEISFTEHAPLPPTFIDPTPEQDSAMKREYIDSYISDIQQLKHKYKNDIKINVGFEVDFIEGFEEETTKFLSEYGRYIDDSILSVHFLKKGTDYVCIDFSAEVFKQIITMYGTIDHIYDAYYNTVMRSILTNLGPFKPKRIGHITLIHKFQRQFPSNNSFKDKLLGILREMEKQSLQLDYNGAGVVKPLCMEPYPPNWVVEEALNRNIPLVYGSDAHSVNGLNQGFDSLISKKYLTSPSFSRI